MTNAERAASRAGPPSITSRLVLLYTVGALGILTTVAALLYVALSKEMRRQNDQDVITLLEVLTKDAEEIDTHFLLPAEDPQHELYQLRVFDEHMRVLASSSRMPEIPYPGPMATASDISFVRSRGAVFLTAANWTKPKEGVPLRMVQIALEETDDEQLIDHYGLIAAGAVLLSSLAFYCVGIIVARRGLRPLKDVTRAAERIDAKQLHERLISAEWPRELRDLAEAFNRMLARLDKTFSSLSTSSSKMAHELRTPLTNLIGEAEIALSKERQPEEYRKVLESSLEEYQRLRQILEAILFISRIENRSSRLSLEAFDATDETRKVIDLFESMSAENEVEVSLSGGASIEGNPTLYGQAVSNVLHNALKSTPPGGRIAVRISEDGGTPTVLISDTGRGIAADAVPHVTDAFFKVEKSLQGPGIGLGLAIVKSIVSWHGGSLNIRSEVGRGTEVRMTFPKRPGLGST